jgi:LysR family hydrogen peroxide-inducible transcriptional activator
MSLEQLAYALAVARYKSFVLAAEKVSVTQPALTMQVKKLEAELGFVLFDRSRKPLMLTAEGKIYLERAQEFMLSFRELSHLAEELKNQEGGELRLAIIPTLSPYLIPLFLDHFRGRFPDVKISIAELPTEYIIRQIKEGELDAGIFATPVMSTGIYFQPLFYEKFFLYVSQQHPWFRKVTVNIADLAGANIWLLREGNCFRSQVSDICQLQENRQGQNKFIYESSSIESLMRIVEYHGGMTLIPELATLAVSAEQEGLLKEISKPAGVRQISLAFSRYQHKKRLLDGLQTSILQHIPRHMLQPGEAEIIDSYVKV